MHFAPFRFYFDTISLRLRAEKTSLFDIPTSILSTLPIAIAA